MKKKTAKAKKTKRKRGQGISLALMEAHDMPLIAADTIPQAKGNKT